MLVNMKDMLQKAKEEHYGVGFFNAVNVEMARAVIETAEEMQAPVIVGTAEVLLPCMPLRRVSEYLLPMAKMASVPVAVHFDHGLTFEKCMEALRLGFSSIMYDCSMASYASNLSKVSEMVRICHGMGVTVEGELGHVGDNDGEGRLENPVDFFTDPAVAEDFVRRTGVDALAVAAGNAHGDYKLPPKLDFGRITDIAERTGVPLVLHGGSGLADSDFKEAIRCGICKVNIFTDLDRAGKEGIESGLRHGVNSISGLMPYEMEAMKAAVKKKMELFGSFNRASKHI